MPSSATPANPESALKSVIVVEDPASGEEDPEEELRGKNLVQWLGMKDGISASMASQGSIITKDHFRQTVGGHLVVSCFERFYYPLLKI